MVKLKKKVFPHRIQQVFILAKENTQTAVWAISSQSLLVFKPSTGVPFLIFQRKLSG